MPGVFSTLLPADLSAAPRAVQEQLRRVQELRERLPAARESVAGAQAALKSVEAADRIRMSEMIRAGRRAEPDERALAAAQTELRRSEAQLSALDLAIVSEERALGATIARETDRWLAAVRKQKAARTKTGLAALAELESSIEAARAAEFIETWLTSDRGLVAEKRCPLPGVGTLPSSDRITANASGVSTSVAIGWFRELLDPQPVELPRIPASPLMRVG
jgi:hypothetical protein